MKNTLSQLLFLILTTFIISASSCHKEDPVPDLVPITTTGAAIPWASMWMVCRTIRRDQ
jgi:hypothetical protein